MSCQKDREQFGESYKKLESLRTVCPGDGGEDASQGTMLDSNLSSSKICTDAVKLEQTEIFNCGICGDVFDCHKDLDAHEKLSHTSVNDSLSKSQGERGQADGQVLPKDQVVVRVEVFEGNIPVYVFDVGNQQLRSQSELEGQQSLDPQNSPETMLRASNSGAFDYSTCRLCKKACGNRQIYLTHLRIKHIDELLFECKVCKAKYLDQEELEWYKCLGRDGSDSNEGHLKCKECGNETSYMYVCQSCDMEFDNRRKVIMHQKVHSKGRKRYCHMCDMYFIDLKETREHLGTHFPMPGKTNQTERLQAFHTSEGTHQKEQYVFKCEICSKAFDFWRDFMSHRKVHVSDGSLSENKPVNDSAVENSTYQIRCVFCNEEFELEKLFDHPCVHVNSQSKQCPICRKRTTGQRNFVRHTDLHGYTRTYRYKKRQADSDTDPNTFPSHVHIPGQTHQCAWCKKEFQDLSKLVCHTHIHIAQGRNCCPVCKNWYSCMSYFSQHIKEHGIIPPVGERSYNMSHVGPCPPEEQNCCKWCAEEFESAQDLVAHNNLHIPPKGKRRCPVCGMWFPQFKAGFRTHLKTHNIITTYVNPWQSFQTEGSRASSQEAKEGIEELPKDQSDCISLNEPCGKPPLIQSSDFGKVKHCSPYTGSGMSLTEIDRARDQQSSKQQDALSSKGPSLSCDPQTSQESLNPGIQSCDEIAVQQPDENRHASDTCAKLVSECLASDIMLDLCCKWCHREFEDILELVEHTRIHVFIGMNQCPVCRKWFTKRTSFKQHLKFHGIIPPHDKKRMTVQELMGRLPVSQLTKISHSRFHLKRKQSDHGDIQNTDISCKRIHLVNEAQTSAQDSMSNQVQQTIEANGQSHLYNISKPLVLQGSEEKEEHVAAVDVPTLYNQTSQISQELHLVESPVTSSESPVSQDQRQGKIRHDAKNWSNVLSLFQPAKGKSPCSTSQFAKQGQNAEEPSVVMPLNKPYLACKTHLKSNTPGTEPGTVTSDQVSEQPDERTNITCEPETVSGRPQDSCKVAQVQNPLTCTTNHTRALTEETCSNQRQPFQANGSQLLKYLSKEIHPSTEFHTPDTHPVIGTFDQVSENSNEKTKAHSGTEPSDQVSEKPNNERTNITCEPDTVSGRPQDSCNSARGEPLCCEWCKKTFLDPKQLGEHCAEVHISWGRNRCPICEMWYNDPKIFQRHLGLHEIIIPPLKYQTQFSLIGTTIQEWQNCCKWCCEDFDSLQALKLHVRLHIPKNKLHCPVCRMKFPTVHQQANFDFHLRGHGISLPHRNKEKIPVDTSSERTKSQCNLSAKKSQHADVPNSDISRKGMHLANDTQLCTYVYDPMSSTFYLVQQTANEKGQSSLYASSYPLIPQGSGEGLQQQSSAATDETTLSDQTSQISEDPMPVAGSSEHTPTSEKEFNCDHCKKYFPTAGKLKDHQHAHFPCYWCKKTFISALGLRKHYQTCHPGGQFVVEVNGQSKEKKQIYRCEICYQFFNLKTKYDEHRNLHVTSALETLNESPEIVGDVKAFTEVHNQSAVADAVSHGYQHIPSEPAAAKSPADVATSELSCLWCAKDFSKWAIKKQLSHKQSHIAKGRNRCPICKTWIHTGEGLRTHLQVHGIIIPPKVEKSSTKGNSRFLKLKRSIQYRKSMMMNAAQRVINAQQPDFVGDVKALNEDNNQPVTITEDAVSHEYHISSEAAISEKSAAIETSSNVAASDELLSHQCLWCAKDLSHLASKEQESHEQSHIAKGRNRCPMCKKWFPTGDYLRTHLQVHGVIIPPEEKKKKVYSKFVKPKKSPSIRDRKIKRPATPRVQTPFKEGKYRCAWSICNHRGFVDVAELVDHTHVHISKRSNRCPACRKVYSKTSVYLKHLKEHGIIAPDHIDFEDEGRQVDHTHKRLKERIVAPEHTEFEEEETLVDHTHKRLKEHSIVAPDPTEFEEVETLVDHTHKRLKEHRIVAPYPTEFEEVETVVDHTHEGLKDNGIVAPDPTEFEEVETFVDHTHKRLKEHSIAAPDHIKFEDKEKKVDNTHECISKGTNCCLACNKVFSKTSRYLKHLKKHGIAPHPRECGLKMS